MITLISPNEFKTIPWKNGLGHTTELAISDGGNLDNFAWRLSIASVVNDGDFSNFSGYQRNLVLIEGAGLTLDHHNGDVDKLIQLLDIARFDGANKTHGSLLNGGIKDFNIMTKQTAFSAEVNCYIEQQSIIVELLADSLLFAYSLTDTMMVNTAKDKDCTVPVGHLVKLQANNSPKNSQLLNVSISGKNMIIMQLKVNACL
ncbi:HutD/Ves family protein [Colwellia sp. TT2012]|uniref:HutD/Ves family protein n=1 Tax=Colwellia sp. TT2012 TaxID=1720342 RepID=UPI00070A61AD|nr:HutD family protein [Colwellia sp. TT2012]